KKNDSKMLVDTNSINNKSHQNLKIINFSNNSLMVEVSSDTSYYLIFLQNYYSYWKATINEELQPILKVNDTFMATKIKKGKHTVKFSFYPKKIVYAAYFSIASWILFIVILIFEKTLGIVKYYKTDKKIIRALAALFTF
ncbi:MAG: hypothetical protein DRJ10_18825, partial [Bacteroidetes bacterium]